MIPIILMMFGSLCQEAQESLGKTGMLRHIESPYAMGFLGLIWSSVFFMILALLAADLRFSLASLPTFTLRLILEIILAQTVVIAIMKAQISVIEFVKTLTVPLLLVVDLLLGYSLDSSQILGICLVSSALLILFWHNPAGKPGAGLAAFGALVAVGTTSLFKYDITHYNSVIGEQVVMLTLLTLYFYFLSVTKGHDHPIRMLHQRLTGPQSLLNGVAIIVLSFALNLAPASIIMALKRVFSIFWAILFGRKYFHETNSQKRFLAFLMVGAGVTLIAL